MKLLLLAILACFLMGTTVMDGGVTVTGGVEIYRILEGPPGDPFTADLQALGRTSCTAPCHLYFWGLDSVAPDGVTEREFLEDGKWEIDYGDPGKGSWSRGVRADGGGVPHDKNVDRAWIGGHLYETQGAYTVTLTIEYGGATRIDSVEVTINDPESVYSGAATTCVAAVLPVAGSDGCPSTATGLIASSDFDAAIATAGVDSGGGRILFRRGETFVQDTVVNFTGTGERQIGSYGTGGRAVVDCATVGTPFQCIVIEGDLDSGTTFFGVQIEGDSSLESSSCIYVPQVETPGSSPTWVTFWDVGVRYCDNLIWARNNSNSADPVNETPTHWGLFESELQYQAGNGGLSFFWTGRYLVERGTLMGDALLRPTDGPSGEHVARRKWCYGCTSEANDYGWHDHSGVQQQGRDVVGCCFNNTAGGGSCDNPGRGGTILTYRDGFAIELPGIWSEYNVLADAHVAKCKFSVEDLAIGTTGNNGEANAPGSVYTGEFNNFYLVEDILFTSDGYAASGISTWAIRIQNSANIFLRNIGLDSTPIFGGSSRFVNIQTHCQQQPDAEYVTPGDVSIKNVLIHQNSSTAESRTLVSQTSTIGTCNPEYNVEIDGSVMWQPGGATTFSSGTFLSQTCCGGGACPGTCNVEPTNEPYPGYTGSDATMQFFTPSAPSSGQSPLEAMSCSQAALRDALGCVRETSGTCDAGPVDLGAYCGG